MKEQKAREEQAIAEALEMEKKLQEEERQRK